MKHLTALTARAASHRAARPVRSTFNRLVGPNRGARVELDLSREKAFWLGSYEPEVQEFLRQYVRPGHVFYDVGAHIGFLSICAARLGAAVFAFEPSTENARRLRRHAELNDLFVEVAEVAVWDEEGAVDLVPGDSDSEWRAVPGTSVPTVTIDSWAAVHPSPQIVKIDAEGAEGRVLAGAQQVLAEARPIVVCELHGGRARSEVLDALEGYFVQELAASHIVAVPANGA